jgi:hypothetical protein
MLNFHTEYKTSKRRFKTINSLRYEIDKWNITESRKSLKKADPIDFCNISQKNLIRYLFLVLHNSISALILHNRTSLFV